MKGFWGMVMLILLGGAVFAQTQSGKASYYANSLAGRKTASGDVYRPKELTAAHKSLPFHTMVRVTNLENGKEIVVRVNDRGPFIPGRIIDLSYAAAQQLGFLKQGIAPVEIKVLHAAELNTLRRKPLPADCIFSGKPRI